MTNQAAESSLSLQGGQFSIEQFASTSKLPTLPEVAIKLIELAQQDEPDSAEVCRVIRSDPVMSGKVMTTVNSALLGFRPKVQTIEDAVNKLGVNMIRTLLLSFHLAQHKTHQIEITPMLQEHWRSSLTQAVLAELIAEKTGNDTATLFLAAMLQDIGILAMLSESPLVYSENVLESVHFPDVIAAERCFFGFCHLDVSIAIMKKWGLPGRFQDATGKHHDQFVEKADNQADRMPAILRAASLGATIVLSKSSEGLAPPLDQWLDFLRHHFSLSPEDANEIISDVNSLVKEYSALFQFKIGENIRSEKIIELAKDMLQEIALANQLELVSNRRTEEKRNSSNVDLYRDVLSGLYNRRYMNDRLTDIVELSIRKRRSIAMLFLDVDKFKEINDTYGHSVGDEAIRHVASWLNNSIRHGDTAIRLGGDEFLIILESIKEPNFESVARRVAEDIPPMVIGDQKIKIGLSVGGTFYEPLRGDVADPNWLIDQADRSMYEAKRNGGGRLSLKKFNGQSPAI